MKKKIIIGLLVIALLGSMIFYLLKPVSGQKIFGDLDTVNVLTILNMEDNSDQFYKLFTQAQSDELVKILKEGKYKNTRDRSFIDKYSYFLEGVVKDKDKMYFADISFANGLMEYSLSDKTTKIKLEYYKVEKETYEKLINILNNHKNYNKKEN